MNQPGVVNKPQPNQGKSTTETDDKSVTSGGVQHQGNAFAVPLKGKKHKENAFASVTPIATSKFYS